MTARAPDTMTTAPRRKRIIYMGGLRPSMHKVAKLVILFKENPEISKDGTVKDGVVGIRCPDQSHQSQG